MLVLGKAFSAAQCYTSVGGSIWRICIAKTEAAALVAAGRLHSSFHVLGLAFCQVSQ